jgi:hypothetical protein
MASTSLEKTFGQVGNRQTWTFSAWIKRAGLGTGQNIFSSFPQSTDYQRIMFNSSDKLYNAEVGGGATAWEVETDAVYRDTSAWYHLVLRQDTTEATADNRVRIYINNVQQTFGTNTQPAQNRGTQINTADVHKIGKGDASEYFDGEMSHIHWCDGQSYAPTAFGEYDANGVWKIKTSPSVTYGTNGFFILKDGNSVTDQSGNGNNWTVAGGTLTNTEDNPSNVFATLNFLNKEIGGATLSNGNNKLVTGSGTPYTGKTNATLGASTGKYYWEVKPTTDPSTTFHICAIVGEDFDINNSTTYLNANGTEGKSYISFKMANGNIATNFTGTRVDTSYGNAVSTNDIIGVALDLDNGKIFFSINGTWQNSGDPVTGTNPASSDVGSLGGDIVFPAFGDGNYATSATLEINFGNGYFGTTAVASAGTNASGIGIFEYDVPTGYTALSTKGLNL